MVGRGPRRAATIAGIVALAILAMLAAACRGVGSSVPSPDPDLRGSIGGTFLWAGETAPELALGPVDPAAIRADLEAARAVIGEDRDPTFPVAILATYPSPADAETAADEVRDLLEASAAWYEDPANADARDRLLDPTAPPPLTAPEAAALRAALLASSERGIGFGGAAADAADAVRTIGPIVVVTGLKTELGYEEEPPLHPLAHLLSAAGAEVVVDGDWLEEASVVVDLSCAPDGETTGRLLLDDVGDAIGAAQYHVRPPWVGPVTAAQALARATVRRWQLASARAMADVELESYVDRLQDAVDDPAAYEALVGELGQKIATRSRELLDGPVDGEVLTRLVAQPTVSSGGAYADWLRAIGERMGQLPLIEHEGGYVAPAPDDAAVEIHGGSLRHADGRLDLGFLSPADVPTSLPLLVAHLVEAGCGDVRFRLLDGDEFIV